MQAAKKLLLGMAIALAGAGALSTDAYARTVVYANIAPPPMRDESPPAPRPGYVWIGGNWYWSHHKYAWRHGHWARERRGYHYVPSRWEREGHRWRYHGERWEH